MSKQFYLTQVVILAIAAILLLLYLPVGDILDQKIILPYIDLNYGFGLKNIWWYDNFSHYYLKLWQEFIFLLILIGIFIRKYQFRWLILQDNRPYIMILVMCLISTSMIGILKHFSSHSCPWSILQLHNQHIQFIQHVGQGGCFPGGHASLGYAWCAGFFAFYQTNRKLAHFYLISGLILGTTMGFIQMMRGAHFISHNFWTLWITWAIDFIIYTLFILAYPYRFKNNTDRQSP